MIEPTTPKPWQRLNPRLLLWRLGWDRVARHGIAFGGISIILAIVLIFFYLAYVVAPLFKPARTEAVATYVLPQHAEARSVFLAMEEQDEIGLRVSSDGLLLFFKLADGSVVKQSQLHIPHGTSITAFNSGEPAHGLMVFGLSNGNALVVRHHYDVSYPDNKRLISPEVDYPLGEKPVRVDDKHKPLHQVAVQENGDALVLAASTDDHRLLLVSFEKQTSFLSEEVTFARQATSLEHPVGNINQLLLDKDVRELYTVNEGGELSYFDVSDRSNPVLVQHIEVAKGRNITAARFLAGGISLLLATERGRIMQWFPVRDESGKERLTFIREFEPHRSAITQLAPEYNRKGFLAVDADGQLGIYHSTAHVTVLKKRITDKAIDQLAISPRANALLAEDASGRMFFWRIENEHPEVSWSSLWGKVWYESYQQPEYLWQSSSASNDFEPKFSLTPISFGTLKAAFYAMLLAVPLSIMGAMFTAQFMAPRMRRVVKPSIEIMEALPTVILGFLAGLWLAPFVETNLLGIFSLLLIIPPAVILAAYAWQRAPANIRHSVPDGWEAALLIPVVILASVVALELSPWLEVQFFGGSLRTWLSQNLGVDYDQRNALVVGIAMGFAVIPTIFSIAEDALFAVPKHLVQGSLALGATPWQTLVRVVILTASPGIFSAVMIGLGRAVGETMIVLMATGNTPVMDFSIFQGMRTLSANVAVEMPESELGSTHYRVLFLAALVLFVFTFVFNTVAEIVRQRLRRKYSSL